MKNEIINGLGIVEIVVRQEYAAVLDRKEIHPVYSTFWLAYHAELAARRAIEPYFDEGENAVGTEISIRHCAMAAIGEHITIKAKVIEAVNSKIVCEILALTGSDRIIAIGKQTQVVMLQNCIDELIHQAQLRKNKDSAGW